MTTLYVNRRRHHDAHLSGENLKLVVPLQTNIIYTLYVELYTVYIYSNIGEICELRTLFYNFGVTSIDMYSFFFLPNLKMKIFLSLELVNRHVCCSQVSIMEYNMLYINIILLRFSN